MRFYQHLPVKTYLGFDLFSDQSLFELAYKKALIITNHKDKHVDSLKARLHDRQIETHVYDTFKKPLTKTGILKAASHAKALSCDFIIAYGNATTLDLAKGCARFAYEDEKLFDGWAQSGLTPPFKDQPLPLMMIPTSLNLASSINPKVFYHDEKNERFRRLKDDSLYPTMTLIDASLIKTKDLQESLYTLLDALMRSFEMTLKPEHFIEKEKGLYTFKTIVKEIKAFKQNPSDKHVRLRLLYALLKIHTLYQPKTKLPLHQLCDAIEGMHVNLPHRLFLARAIPFYIETLSTKLPNEALNRLNVLFEDSPYASKNIYASFKDFYDDLNLAWIDFEDYGVELALISDYIVHLKGIFYAFDALSDDALYDIIEQTLLARRDET